MSYHSFSFKSNKNKHNKNGFTTQKTRINTIPTRLSTYNFRKWLLCVADDALCPLRYVGRIFYYKTIGPSLPFGDSISISSSFLYLSDQKESSLARLTIFDQEVRRDENIRKHFIDESDWTTLGGQKVRMAVCRNEKWTKGFQGGKHWKGLLM